MDEGHTHSKMFRRDDEVPFLDHNNDDEEDVPKQYNTRSHSLAYVALLHCSFALLYAVLTLYMVRSSKLQSDTPFRPALQDLDVSFSSRQYGLMRDSSYIGPPSNATDASWIDLFSTMSIRVSDAELSTTQQSSVALPDGGYLAWLGVYHELHCVKVLRKMVYREHYYPKLDDSGLRDRQVHADHCVDLLRQALMCHGDVGSLTTFLWDERFEKPLLSPQRPLHKCYNWDGLVDSLGKRVVEERELDMMKRS
ncbi:unnamed protein product [Periconia digitata]|uniref:Uncharacterized protein n=1 Tax=Periconia digitata TaxID=1303443 RepID=A0A9W4UI33_9PLEO|nr:unnamed protein product [Periconia digitata]